MDLYPFFDWLDTSLLADISKAYGGVFAVVQMFHLLGMSLLGGMVLVGDLRLLNLVMKDIPSEEVIENTYKWFNVGLVTMVISGIFMSSAVSLKLYYNEMFWAKMTALAVGVAFVYFVRKPLLSTPHDALRPSVIKLTAITSMAIWFTVAASGPIKRTARTRGCSRFRKATQERRFFDVAKQASTSQYKRRGTPPRRQISHLSLIHI